MFKKHEELKDLKKLNLNNKFKIWEKIESDISVYQPLNVILLADSHLIYHRRRKKK